MSTKTNSEIINALLSIKQVGIDCDENGSAYLKYALRHNELTTEQRNAIIELFPLEYSEHISETESPTT